jgi:hypothetical protein
MSARMRWMDDTRVDAGVGLLLEFASSWKEPTPVVYLHREWDGTIGSVSGS